MRGISKAITAAKPGIPMEWAPCRIVSATPLVIDFYSADQFPAQKIAGLTYTNGASGMALLSANGPSKPVVLPLA